MKHLLTLLLSTFALFACNHQAPKAPPAPNNEALVKQYFEYFNQHDWQKMANMYAENAEFKDPSFGTGIVKQTRQQTIEKYATLQHVFPDLHDQIIQIFPSGDKHVIVEFVSTGTGPDSVKFELPICSILTFENGLITKDFTYYDNFEE